jgi:hypothetical protein
MNSGELYDRFRSDVADQAVPYLWSDDDIWNYMDAAYRQFVRLTVGIADFLSPVTRVRIVAGQPVATLDSRILRIMSAKLASDNTQIVIANMTDQPFLVSDDYSVMSKLVRDDMTGPVRYMIIGAQHGKAKWVQIPEVDDLVLMQIYRLPMDTIIDEDHPLDEVDAEHHEYLLDWMKYRAYLKQDAETFDREKSAAAELRFRTYCEQCRREWERYKHKNRVVAYGGL